MLNKESKIYVAGHRGLVGSAIWNNLQQRGASIMIGTPIMYDATVGKKGNEE